MDCYLVIRDRVKGNNNLDFTSIGKFITILLSSFTGSPYTIKEKVYNYIAIYRRFYTPDYFITFTYNPK